jgi:hypothetical protein
MGFKEIQRARWNLEKSKMIRLQDILTEAVDKKNIDAVLKATGYSQSSPEYQLARIIAKKEGWLPDATAGRGSRAYRNNNPGNLDYQDDFKSIDPDVTRENGNGRFAKFSTPVLGAKALIEKKIIKWANGGMPATSTNQNMQPKYNTGDNPTIKQFIYTYAPPNENDTTGYINMVLQGIKSVAPTATQDTRVIDIIKNKKLTPEPASNLQTSDFTIYPNPVATDTELTIKVNPDKLPIAVLNITIYSISGRKITSHTWNNISKGILQFQSPDITGVYLIKITQAPGVTLKFTVQ